MKIMRAAGWTGAVLASLAGYGLSVTSHARASGTPREPRRIILVKAETGLELGQLRWSSPASARGQLDFTGEGAGQIGSVRVSVRRDDAGSIASLRLAGQTGGISKSWTFRHGHWSAS